jgi:hypothetical protein
VELLQSFRYQLKGLIFFAETEPHLLAAALRNTIKTRTGHTSDANLADQVMREFNIIRKPKPGDVSHDV